MARIKIDLNSQIEIFKTQIPLTVNFINYGGHMGNDAILTLCQEARIRYFKSQGFSELNYFGKAVIQSDAAIVYKSEAFLGDILEVSLFADDLNDYGLDFLYLFKNLSNGKEVARAKTGIVFYDYEIKKIAKRPNDLKF